MYVYSGTYVGDGATSRTITGVPFKPVAVFLASTAAELGYVAINVGSQAHAMRTAVVGGAWDTGGTQPDTWTANLNGFTFGSGGSVQNTLGRTYRFTALGDDGSNDIGVLAYTGTGAGHNETGLGFTPELAFSMGNVVNNIMLFRTDRNSAGNCETWSVREQALGITAFVAGGITIATSTDINNSGSSYYVLCLKKSANLLATATYNGNGTDNRDVAHGLGVSPALAIIHKRTVSNSASVMRFSSHVGDLSKPTSVTADSPNMIQSMDATNVNLGTDTLVNVAASTPAYTLITFGPNVPPLATLRQRMLTGVGV